MPFETKHQVMKKFILPLFTVALMSSCTQCYECTQVVDVEVNGQVVEQDTITEDRCAVSSEEVNEWEEAGQSCTAI